MAASRLRLDADNGYSSPRSARERALEGLDVNALWDLLNRP